MKATVLWVVVASVGLGCSSGDSAAGNGRRASAPETSHEPRATAMPHETCVDGAAQGLDVNGDGQVDVRTMMQGGQARCRETDANFDGRVDIYRWFDPATGQVTRVEDDYDFDGRIDVVATYQNGEVASDVLDTNFDGRTDTWRDYRGGRVIELRRDADGDGRVDTWERFDADGRLTYAAVDANHDGQPDQDAADAGAPTAPPAGDAGVGASAAATADGGVR